MIEDIIKSVSPKKNRLIVLVHHSGRENTLMLRNFERIYGYSYFNVNIELSRKLREVSVRDRSFMAEEFLREMLFTSKSDVVLLDHIEILFSKELPIDPLRLLINLSHYRVLIIAWGGVYNGSTLLYAYLGHEAYRSYNKDVLGDTRVISISADGKANVT